MGSIVDKWIAEQVTGKSFCDIGGLWGTVNEKASVALASGASSAAMIDIHPPAHEAWDQFRKHCDKRGFAGVKEIVADATADRFASDVGTFDFVHCSGVLYHCPDPFQLLKNLWRVSSGLVALTSMVIPEEINTKAGRITTAPGELHCIPVLDNAKKAIFSDYFNSLGVGVHSLGGPEVDSWITDDGRGDFGPWWWFITPTTLKAMVGVWQFDVMDEGFVWDKLSYSVLLAKR